jgi:hypothetical protein
MTNSKRILVSIIAVVIAVVGVVGISNQAKAAKIVSTNRVVIYPNNGQRPQRTHRVKVTPLKDFWSVLKYSR